MANVLGSLALFCALGTFAGAAAAQSDEQRANARALADQGVQAFSEGRWQDTVDLFERAESLLDAPTHLLFAARAHAKLGHYVKARELYLHIIREQLGADAPRAFRAAQTSAGDELKEVEPHVGRLTITLRGSDPKAVKVTLDGAVVPGALIGVARPIDPGAHQIQAEAPGFAAQSKPAVVADGASASVVLELLPSSGAPVSSVVGPAVQAPESAGSNPPGAPASARLSDTTPTQSQLGSPSKKKRIAAYAAFGVGAVGVGVGTIFLLSSASKRSQADKKFDECGGSAGCSNDNPLSTQISAFDKSARSAQTVSIIGFVAGGLALGTGVALYAVSGGREPTSSGWSIEPRIGLGSAGVTGTF